MATQPQTRYWTYEDLLALPEDGERYEIIEGVLYKMPAASMDHADITTNLMVYIFGPLMRALGIRVYTAPVDVFIRGGNPVQPDILVLLAEQLALRSQRGIEGPPALVVEVLSPSNHMRDQVTKRDLYARAGVAEYWIVSPEAMSVEILILDGERYVVHARVGGDEPLISPTLPALTGTAAQIFGDFSE